MGENSENLVNGSSQTRNIHASKGRILHTGKTGTSTTARRILGQ